jgi:hypothetical protein
MVLASTTAFQLSLLKIASNQLKNCAIYIQLLFSNKKKFFGYVIKPRGWLTNFFGSPKSPFHEFSIYEKTLEFVHCSPQKNADKCHTSLHILFDLFCP